MSSVWTDEELRGIGSATEVRIASRRPDGTLRPSVVIWGVRSGSGIFVRSAYGPGNGWFRRAVQSGEGRIAAGGIERDVTFEQLDPGSPVQADIDAAYHAKYDSYGPKIVGSVVGPAAAGVTIQVLPS